MKVAKPPVVLLVIALFMYRGFRSQLVAGPGYRTDHLLLMTFDTSLVRYTNAQSAQFFRDVADRAREVPGVVSVAMATSVPMANNAGLEAIAPEGFQFPPGKDHANVVAARVDEHYFDTMQLRLLRGRNFRIEDTGDAPKVAIVNEQFARHSC